MAGASCCWLAAAAAAAGSRASLSRRERRRKGGKLTTARRVWEVALELPEPADLQAAVQAAASGVAASIPAEVASIASTAGATATTATSSAGASVAEAAATAIASLPAPPPEVAAEATKLAAALLRALPPELAAGLPDAVALEQAAAAWAPVGPPAAAGAAITALLALRRGPMPFLEELPRVYDGPWIEAYWQRRPLKLLRRFVEVAIKAGGFSSAVELDKLLGRDEEMMPQRAVEARELITDLGPAFVKIVQVWASRPDILPEAYQKELEKLLEQVRPFGKEEALETLRRNITGAGGVQGAFDDLSAFDKPVASASVGQVYKATVKGREVAVKVQRPDVREQVTLDLFVIRRLAAYGSLLPVERYANQFRSLFELIDRAAPPFIEELDYEREAANQRRFAETIACCDLVSDAVIVPEVLLASREVLVQEWLPGKKLTEQGAAKDQAEKVVKVLLNSYMVQFLETGFLHGDPHPGNFVLTPDGKLGILDYGLMTEVSPARRVAFIEYIMHVQAKMYDECLQDLVNLGFLPQGIADDQEAREVIVPGLASTLTILYEGSGDLREQQKKFKKQREELQKEPGKLEQLREKLQAIAKKYGSFRLPGYMTLILRAFATLEGVGLRSDGSFSIIKECFPYVARRLLTDDSLRIRDALRAYLYKGRKRIAAQRIDDLANGFSSFTNIMKGSRSEAVKAGAPVPEVMRTETAVVAEGSREVAEIDTAAQDLASVVFSPDGNFLQELLIEEGVASVNALSRAALLQLFRALGPFATPLSLPLGFLLGATNNVESVLLKREDKEALLLIRKVVRLVQGAEAPAQQHEAGDQPSRSGGTLLQTVEDLQRLQPIASGLAPSVAPGAVAFSERFLRTLASRSLLRLAEDLERRAGIRRPEEVATA